MRRRNDNKPLPGSVAERVREIVRAEGEPQALSVLGISRATLGRALGQLPLQNGTRYMIEQRVAQLDEGDL